LCRKTRLPQIVLFQYKAKPYLGLVCKSIRVITKLWGVVSTPKNCTKTLA